MTVYRWLRRQLLGRWPRTLLATAVVAFGVATVTAVRLGVASITVPDEDSFAFTQPTAELRESLAESLRPVSLLALVITGIVLGVANRRLVGERWAEFATLRGLGLRRRRLLGWLLGEVGVIAVAGTTVGLGIGAVAGRVLGRVLQQTTGVPTSRSATLDLTTASIAATGGILVPLIATLGTAWMATRATPATMAQPPADDRSVPWAVALVGVVLIVLGSSVARRTDGGAGLAVGVITLYLGGVAIVPTAFTVLARAVRRLFTRGRAGLSDLAVAPLTTHTRRLAVTVAVLASALVVVMVVETLRASQRPAFVEAVEVTWGGDALVSLNDEDVPSLLDDPRVIRTTPVANFQGPGWCRMSSPSARCTTSEMFGEDVATRIIDPDTYFDVAGLAWSDGTDGNAARARLADATGVAVSYLVAERYDIGLGDQLTGFPAGESFEVVGIFYGFPGNGYGTDGDGIVVPTWGPYPAFTQDYLVELESGVSIGNVASGAEDRIYPLKPTRDFYIDQFDRIYQVVSVLGAVTGLLGLLSLIGVTGIEVRSRAEEFRMLRVLGLRRRRLLMLVVGETATLATLAAVVAIVAGTAAGWVLIDAVDAVLPGLPVPPRVPWASAAGLLVIAPVVGAATALGAARTAARI